MNNQINSFNLDDLSGETTRIRKEVELYHAVRHQLSRAVSTNPHWNVDELADMVFAANKVTDSFMIYYSHHHKESIKDFILSESLNQPKPPSKKQSKKK